MSPIRSETQTLRKIECPASAEKRIKESVPHLRQKERNKGQTDEHERCFVAVREWRKSKDENGGEMTNQLHGWTHYEKSTRHRNALSSNSDAYKQDNNPLG